MERIKRDIEALRGISEPGGGVTRTGFTKQYRRGVQYIKSRMEEAGLSVREDCAGNIYGLLEGNDPSAPRILSGSHLDTVRRAGAFDGIAGVACALEAARLLREKGHILRHSYEVVGVIEEEGSRFGRAMLGSQFIEGGLGESDLDLIKDNEGHSLRQILNEYLLGIETCPAYRESGEILAFLELHSEQGPVLEERGVDIGIVENIVALGWTTVTIQGFAGHAGTVPMSLRRDAGIAACKLISKIHRYVTETFGDGAVFTVGRMELSPGSTNCIPSGCVFTMDVRAGEHQVVRQINAFAKEAAKATEKECGVSITMREDSNKRQVQMDAGLRKMIEQSCRELGYTFIPMNSGAGHDAMILANRWPSGMIFVPCHKGVTHNPLECVEWEALAKGTDVLFKTILHLDSDS
jgi:allantoate deiminase